jgi:hypothetical protein
MNDTNDEPRTVLDRFTLAAGAEIARLEEHVRTDHEALARVRALTAMGEVVAAPRGAGPGGVAAEVLAICTAQVRCAITGQLPEDPVGMVIRFTELADPPAAACCDLHKPGYDGDRAVCCDPDDCGPCCENCPTCPVLARAAAKCTDPPAESCTDAGCPAHGTFENEEPPFENDVHAEAAADVAQFGGPDGV